MSDIKPYIQDFLANYGIIVPEGSLTTFVIILAGLTIILMVLLMIAYMIAKAASRKTRTTLDDRLLKITSAYLLPIAFLTALFVSLELVYPALTIGQYTELDLYLMLLLAVLAFLVVKIVDVTLIWYGMNIQPPGKKVTEKKIFPFVRNVLKIGLYLLFAVFILQIAGFDTTALITGLGIGALAVALALQTTLSNFFGGVHILVDKPFKRGDYIILDTGQEGVVDTIGWRTTKILTLARDELVIPNGKLAESIINNQTRPHGETGVYYTIGVAYGSDIDKVVELIKNSVKAVEKKNKNLIPGTVWARIDNYGDFAMEFKFGYLVQGYANKYGIHGEVFREIYKQFNKNKIEIPYPVMVVKKSK